MRRKLKGLTRDSYFPSLTSKDLGLQRNWDDAQSKQKLIYTKQPNVQDSVDATVAAHSGR